MSQAIVNPDELRRFAQQLKRVKTELQGQMATLQGQLAALSETWRDAEQQKFNQEFERALHSVSRFVDAADEHIPFLLRKAERAEEYLRQR